jgi:hypothetical protein
MNMLKSNCAIEPYSPVRRLLYSKLPRRCDMPLRVGDYAPDFCLKSHTGELISLSDFQGKKNVVLAFFPLAWTPI